MSAGAGAAPARDVSGNVASLGLVRCRCDNYIHYHFKAWRPKRRRRRLLLLLRRRHRPLSSFVSHVQRFVFCRGVWLPVVNWVDRSSTGA